MQTSGGAARRSGSSSQSLSPSPSGMSSPEPDARWKSDSSDSEYHDDDDLVNDIPPPPPSTQSLPQNPHPISTTLEVFTNYARELESVYPPNSTPQVIENLRSHVAQGNFVELHELLFPPAPAPSPAPPAKSAPVVTRRKRQEDRKNVLPEIKVEQNLLSTRTISPCGADIHLLCWYGQPGDIECRYDRSRRVSSLCDRHDGDG